MDNKIAAGEIRCKICGRTFSLRADDHYIARDAKQNCLAIVVSDNEPELYDAWDCPYCGAQNSYPGRKRILKLGEIMDLDEIIPKGEKLKEDDDNGIE